MFFKTGNEAVAHWMKPPDTNYLLNLVRPDLLLLRIIAKGLILWDTIEPTKKWIIDQVPGGLFFDLTKGPKDMAASDVDHEANWFVKISLAMTSTEMSIISSQACCNITAGAAFCIGLRYAGTEDPTAFKTLNKILKLFLGMESQFMGEFAGKATVESCLMLIVLSMSLVRLFSYSFPRHFRYKFNLIFRSLLVLVILSYYEYVGCFDRDSDNPTHMSHMDLKWPFTWQLVSYFWVPVVLHCHGHRKQ